MIDHVMHQLIQDLEFLGEEDECCNIAAFKEMHDQDDSQDLHDLTSQGINPNIDSPLTELYLDAETYQRRYTTQSSTLLALHPLWICFLNRLNAEMAVQIRV